MKEFESIASFIQSAIERIRSFMAGAILFSANIRSEAYLWWQGLSHDAGSPGSTSLRPMLAILKSIFRFISGIFSTIGAVIGTVFTTICTVIDFSQRIFRCVVSAVVFLIKSAAYSFLFIVVSLLALDIIGGIFGCGVNDVIVILAEWGSVALAIYYVAVYKPTWSLSWFVGAHDAPSIPIRTHHEVSPGGTPSPSASPEPITVVIKDQHSVNLYGATRGNYLRNTFITSGKIVGSPVISGNVCTFTCIEHGRNTIITYTMPDFRFKNKFRQ